MLWRVICLLAADFSPEAGRLRKISAVFLMLWILDLVMSIYFDCLILKVNALVVLNISVALVAAALSCQYGHDCAVLPCSKGKDGLSVAPSDNNLVKRERNWIQNDTEVNSVFSFGLKRLFVLISFGSSVFVMFGCLTVIGEGLQHAFHSSDMPYSLLFVIGFCHIVLFTAYAEEINAYDCISGRGFENRDVHNLSNGKMTHLSHHLQEPVNDSVGILPFGSAILRATSCAYAPLTCIAVSLMTMLRRTFLWEMAGALLLASYTFVIATRKVKDMAWLLTNNSVCHPSFVAARDRAIRSVKLVEGVLQVKFSVFWEVKKDEIMAIMCLRIMSSADPSAVTVAVRKILEGVATYVFVEARFPNDEDDDTNILKVDHLSHHHSHGHGCCDHSNHFHDSAGERHEGGERDGHERGTEKRREHDYFFPALGSASSSSIYFPSLSQPPVASVVELAERQARRGPSFSSANYSVSTPLQSLTLVPPPFPRPRS
ncbi:hypothetical protein C3747_55g11 [Trypanosoma cruzi]|uniref:Uncharacterized protein n=2 Tax=Trypanosoma cruzi TaxID=5693 RepID=Q4DTC8_TRYCC|nr:hypothetical protein, conserved [Trypanosoma cruzi]EAN95791.1 hypothetical protein, conserved [Trypanosoma cruzi]PWV11881.1 hypothetical protein C3747_55g11 [Trypanosoma cruzi]RNC60449.1 hypothetical protein TcCL_ESM01794 [Trypanosoma cruzi]|eukprot:XP_817642.1 hypothetical protein [Trypanosoma cruzi strain CL Brener]